MKTKPFNLKEALKFPDRVICRDGVKPDEWHYFKSSTGPYPLRFTHKGSLCAADKDGLDAGGASHDLLLTCETKLVPFTYETFFPHKDRWMHRKSHKGVIRADRVAGDSINSGGINFDWETLLDAFTFEDGTPCGVEVEE